VVDRDTQGVPGVPPIVDTIFHKIDSATIFVPDLTFVGKRIDRRPTPNPNVLVEYGWALKSLRYTRIIPVMNVAFGEPTPETMPFDMRHLRHPKCTYSLPTRASRPPQLTLSASGTGHSTGKTRGACPGYRKDHIKPLACGGPDAVWNLQWQTIAAARAKDRWELRACGR
jgi:hypothetical protein